MVIKKLEPEGKIPALQTISAKGYVTTQQSGILKTVATANYATFPSAFAGVPDLSVHPYTFPGSSVATTNYTIAVSSITAGSFKHEADNNGKFFKYTARYFP